MKHKTFFAAAVMLVTILFCGISTYSLDGDKVGKIGEINKTTGEIIVTSSKVSEKIPMGTRLYVKSGNRVIVLEAVYPMQTVARCRVVSGSISSLKAGMDVYLENTAAANDDQGKKKKVFISVITASGVPDDTVAKIRGGIKLVIFEDFKAQYYVLDDESFGKRNTQVASILERSDNSEQAASVVGAAANADEVISGSVSRNGGNLEIKLFSVERRDRGYARKSDVSLSFEEGRLEYAVKEAARRTVDPEYEIDMARVTGYRDLKSTRKGIQAAGEPDASLLQFRTDDEAAARIIDYTRSLVTEADAYYKEGKYAKARGIYMDIIERVRTTLGPDKQEKIKTYMEGIFRRVDSTYIMEYRPAIEKVDKWVDELDEPDDADYNKALKKYDSLAGELAAIKDDFSRSRSLLLDAVNTRRAGICETCGDMNYRAYKFPEAMAWYEKGRGFAGSLNDGALKTEYTDQLNYKVKVTTGTGRAYLVNTVRGHVDQAEFFNFQRETSDAKDEMEKARKLLANMKQFESWPAYKTFNDYAEVMKLEPFKTPRFMDNGDGTVIDTYSGLVWLKNANLAGKKMTWKEAVAYCEKLNASGYSDWRCPTKEEMASLVKDYSAYTNWQESLGKEGFEKVESIYWTSSENTSDSKFAWLLTVNEGYAITGDEDAYNKTNAYCVWSVRGEVKAGVKKNLESFTLIDNTTPANVTIDDFRTIIGFGSYTTKGEVYNRLGAPDRSDDNYLDKYSGPDASWSGITIHCKKDEFIFSIFIDRPAVVFLSSKSITDKKLNFLGKHKSVIIKTFGQPDEISEYGYYEYEVKSHNVGFRINEKTGMCEGIRVYWKRQN